MASFRQARRRFQRNASLVVLASLVSRVRAAFAEPAPVCIDSDGIVVFGLRVTHGELFMVLTGQRVKAVLLHASGDDFKAIGKMIYGLARAGIENKSAATK
ncbi:MAG: hypothetical protein ABIT83_22845 [Massilia sp.]